jgi:hypothetical protein
MKKELLAFSFLTLIHLQGARPVPRSETNRRDACATSGFLPRLAWIFAFLLGFLINLEFE